MAIPSRVVVGGDDIARGAPAEGRRAAKGAERRETADEDGAGDGRLLFSLSRMRPLLLATGSPDAASPPPPNLAGQDLLVLLGAERLEVSILRPGAGK